jgi:hypothetical protein
VVNKPVHLLHMVRTVRQNDRQQFQNGHSPAIVRQHYTCKGADIVSLQKGTDVLLDGMSPTIPGSGGSV